ncbi:hypothetical protein ENBRE01_2749 [Enteropsectra breve]|nr:hypothetical protein ENBRE01_2749 [Enteropsectra breve]
MESQFLLKLMDDVQHIDIYNSKLQKISPKEVELTFKDTKYPGIICRIPTITESYKALENKLYKISNISTLVVVYGARPSDIEAEIMKHERSGLTPPAEPISDIWEASNTVYSDVASDIERKVRELLEEDARASKVEIISDIYDASEDLDELAAEIEKGYSESKGASSEPRAAKEASHVSTSVEKTAEKHKGAEFIQINCTGSDHEAAEHLPEGQQRTKGEEYLAAIHSFETRIKEKEEQKAKALNPILRKRFADALDTLTKEYEEFKRKTQ